MSLHDPAHFNNSVWHGHVRSATFPLAIITRIAPETPEAVIIQTVRVDLVLEEKSRLRESQTLAAERTINGR
jgi:hypothetical protein